MNIHFSLKGLGYKNDRIQIKVNVVLEFVLETVGLFEMKSITGEGSSNDKGDCRYASIII
jgi:hypothetical protein